MKPCCRELACWVTEADGRGPGPGRRFLLWLHLRRCPPCREYLRQIREVGELAREGTEDPCPDRCRELASSICRELGLPEPEEDRKVQ